MAAMTERRNVHAVVDQLVGEFGSSLPAGTVVAEVARCQAALIRAGVRSGLAPATEAMARCRLSRRAAG
ncbi:hypothetical protein [Georgenia sp. AZ-5]|uniref:hypothetical protein n=1 Tax=Georgenia sp. AZ-5 TaxID=3367526 RepID=UPI003754FD2D